MNGKKYYDKFQEIIAEDQPYTFLFVRDSLPIISSRFQGIDPAPAELVTTSQNGMFPSSCRSTRFSREVDMARYLLKRILLMIPVVLGITIISFGVMKIAPGDPISLYTDLNPNMNQETIKRMRAHYGLDQPVYVQYWKWLRNMLMLDFGTIVRAGQPPRHRQDPGTYTRDVADQHSFLDLDSCR